MEMPSLTKVGYQIFQVFVGVEVNHCSESRQIRQQICKIGLFCKN